MNTEQLVVRSAVTLVATGLTLLSSGTSEARGRGPSGMRMSGSRGGINNGAIRQSISNRAMNRGNGMAKAIGRNNSGRLNGRDDHGGRGERQRGDDRGRGQAASMRERGDDHGRHRERGDDHGCNGTVTAANASVNTVTANANRATITADSNRSRVSNCKESKLHAEAAHGRLRVSFPFRHCLLIAKNWPGRCRAGITNHEPIPRGTRHRFAA